MDIAGNQIYEGRDGTIEIVGINGYVVIPAKYRKEFAELLSKRIPRIKCMFCGNEGNHSICQKCADKHEEASAPKFRWQVLVNGKQMKSGKSSKFKAYVVLTKYAYSRGARRWIHDGEYYENDKGERFLLHFGELQKRRVQQVAAVPA